MENRNGSSGRLDRIAWELDWNLLRTFMVIAQEGGLTAAGARLRLKQPTISNALRRLEERLGKRLIERGPRVFRLTGPGEELYRECREIFGTVSRLGVALREVRDEITGHVRIAMASHVICALFDETLAEFNETHPAATISIHVETSRAVADLVLERRAALGICLVRRREPALDYVRLYREHFGFFCGPRHRHFGRSGLTLADLRNEPSVSFETEQLDDALEPIALLRARAEFARRMTGVSSNLEEVRRLIVAGLGIGPLPIHVVARDVRDGVLWRLPPYDDPPAIDIYALSNPAARLNRAEQAFISILRRRIDATPIGARTYGLTD